MRSILLVVLAALLFVGVANAQPNVERVHKYLVYVSAKNTTDTIPGHEVGNGGAGYAGWIYVGGDDVMLTYWAKDSVQSNVYVDFADSGVSSGSTSSDIDDIPFGTVSVAENDTLESMDATGDMQIVTRTLRNQATNSIGGARYLRFRVWNLNADNFAAAAGDRVIRLTVLRIKR